MSFKTKLDACINRFNWQMRKSATFLNALDGLYSNENFIELIQLANESLIVRIFSSLEEYLKCLVFLATCLKEKSVREFFANCGNDSIKRQVKKCDLGTLGRFAKKEISFKDKTKKTKRIFNFLFGFSPFSNRENENFILDLNLVRNIIVHNGGWPNENHANQITTQDVIIESNRIELKKNSKPSIFYHLDLVNNDFILNVFRETMSVGNNIEKKLQKNSDFSFIKK